MARFEVFPDKAGLFRWRLRADDGEIVSESDEQFESRQDAEAAAKNKPAMLAGRVEPEVVHVDDGMI